jgi:hypothetical protein
MQSNATSGEVIADRTRTPGDGATLIVCVARNFQEEIENIL